MSNQGETLESLVIDETSAFVFMDSEGIRPVVFQNPIKTVIAKSLEYRDRTDALQHHAPVIGDLIGRKILDPATDIESGIPTKNELTDFNFAIQNAGDPKRADAVALDMSFIAYGGVVLRPLGVEMPLVDRRLHRSDVRAPHGNEFLWELMRHRRNALYDLMQIALKFNQADRSRASSLVQQINKTSFLETVESVSGDAQKLSVLSRMCVSEYARKLFPIFELGVDEVEVLRKRFVDRGLAINAELGADKIIGEDYFHADIDETSRIHILRGDKRGGGHHLPEIDTRFKKVVSDVLHIPGSANERAPKIPVAVTETYDEFGRKKGKQVDTFFPYDWSSDEVIEAVQHPDTFLYETERGGRLLERFISRGVEIFRVSNLYEDCDDVEVVTAYPVTTVPEDVKAKLRSK